MLVTVCSWLRFVITGSMKVDESYPSVRAGTALFVVLLVGWSMLVYGWVGFLRRPPERPRLLAYVGLGVASLMLPLLSNDVYSVFAQAWAAAHERDVFTSTQSLHDSPWFSFVGEHWRNVVCKYGPLSLYASMPASLVKGPLLARCVLRLTWTIPLVAVMEASFRTLQALRPDSANRFHTMVWLNPLFLIEGPGQMHVDLLGLMAITAALLLHMRGRVLASRSAWALAVLCKWNLGLTAVWFCLCGARTLRQSMTRAVSLVAILVLLGLILYFPVWRGTGTILVPLRALADQNPGGSIVDVVGELVHVLRAGHVVVDAHTPADVLDVMKRAEREGTWRVVSMMTTLVAIVVSVPVLRRMLRKRDEDVVSAGTGALVVIATTIVSPVFHSWYLLAALPFFGLSCSPAWRKWWVVVVALSVTEGFSLTLPRDATLFAICVALSTGATALAFFWRLRSRFWDDFSDA